jgi:type II secretory ATPase GspE/PulE/Tfp pilus assembly ATPase PilB-like protein
VFSTLHTNTASGTFPRLIDLGVNPKIISSAINIAMAQRLVRKICQDCKKELPLEGEDKKTVDKVLESISDKSIIDGLQTDHYYHGVGCDKCNGLGYRGRIGIFEAIIIDENIEKIIQENPSEREISKVSKSQNIPDMTQDGVIKVLQGVTSLEELRRVIDVEKL